MEDLEYVIGLEINSFGGLVGKVLLSVKREK